MANEKITDLTDIGTPDNLDVLEIVDVSDTTDSPAGTSKSVKVSELKQNISGLMVKSNNLSDVTNVATARTNLEVYSTGEVDMALGLKQETLTAVDISGTSTIVGFSVISSILLNVIETADTMFVIYQISGTSNDTTLTFTLPSSVSSTQRFRAAEIRNNGVFITTPALVQVTGNTVQIFNGTSSFTSAGTKSASGFLILSK